MIALNALPRAASPEEVGVSSERLAEFFTEFEKSEYHAFMVVRHGKVAAEWYRYPFTADNDHILYSVSKSITATACGFAITEGLISLDTRVIDVLTDYAPKHPDETLKRLNLGHLISLSSGISTNVAKSKTKGDWIREYFNSKRKFLPGEGFEYVNENFHIACAMLQRVTGQSVVDFLYPRLFEPLGIPKPFWEGSRDGIEAGGWGLFLSLENLAKIALCYQQNGVFNGRQIIPAQWIEEAIKNHKSPKVKKESGYNASYGYGIWRRQSDFGPYRFDGLYGQLVEVYPEHDAFVVSIGGDNGDSRNTIFEHFPAAFTDDAVQPGEDYAHLCELIKTARRFDPLPAGGHSELEKSIDGKLIRFRRPKLLAAIDMPVSVLTIAATYMLNDRGGNINNIRFRFESDVCKFSWTEHGRRKGTSYSNTVECGMDGSYRVSPITLCGEKYTAYSSARWESDGTFTVVIRPIESIDARILNFTFDGNRVFMRPSSEHTIKGTIDGIGGVIRRLLKKDELVKKAKLFLANLLEPVHKGRIKKA